MSPVPTVPAVPTIASSPTWKKHDQVRLHGHLVLSRKQIML
jgi:hypothetical protein